MTDLKSNWRPGQKYTADAINSVAKKVNALATQVDEIEGGGGGVGDLSDLGVTVTATELNRTGGVTAPIQDQLDGKVESSYVDSAVSGVDVRLGESYRPVQGIAPGITQSVTAGQSLAAQVLPWYDYWKRWRYCGCLPEAVDGDASLCLNNNNTLAQGFVLQPIVFEFWSDATEIRMHGFQVGRPDYWAMVDDMRLSTGWLHGDFADNYATWTITQPTAILRKWRICVPGSFTGFSTNAGALVVPTIAKGPQVAVVGDSLVQGNISIDNAVSPGVAGYINSGAAFGEFEQFTGIDVWRCGVEGTGYVNESSYGVNGPYGSAQRVAGLAALPAMDVVIAFGTVNDGSASESALVTAANAAWTAMAAAQPSARLVVVGMEHIGPFDATLDAKDAALLAAAAAHADVSSVVDVRTDPFITGTGYDGNPQGDGNQDAFAATDATHPTHAGSRYWAENLVRMLRPI